MNMYKGYKINNPNYDAALTFKAKSKKISYLESWVSLDTETSHNHNEEEPSCWLYQWAFTFNKSIYYGRTPEQLCEELNKISKFYNLDLTQRIKIFVHNLPYDFSYLISYFEKYFGGHDKVLAYSTHKVFNIVYNNGLEFCCSYKLSNDSLDRWSKKLGTKHHKLVGYVNYEKIHYQNSPLYRKDWLYQFNDVIVLDECIQKHMEMYNIPNIAKITLTSTGIVREEIKKNYLGNHRTTTNRKKFLSTRLSVRTYMLCREEFSGGISHGNRCYKAMTLVSTDSMKIKHRDFRSHYPSQQRCMLFPMEPFVLFKQHPTIEEVAAMQSTHFCLCDCYLLDARLKDRRTPLPYIQTSHVLRFKQGFGNTDFDYLDDNGRIIGFYGLTSMVLDINEILYIKKQYDVEIIINECYVSRLGRLPQWFTSIIDKHFKGKSDFKDIVKQLKLSDADYFDILNAEMNLMKSKNIVNGIYGCSATDPVRNEIDFNHVCWSETKAIKVSDIEEKLDKYYDSYSSYMRYQWGIATTIYARLELCYFADLIDSVNIGNKYGNVIYADTDSLFYFSTDAIEKLIEEENNKLYNNSIFNHAYITTAKGETIVYNQFEEEKEDILRFRFLHSKCYAYETKEKDGIELHVTIAGVTKNNGKRERNSKQVQWN